VAVSFVGGGNQSNRR